MKTRHTHAHIVAAILACLLFALTAFGQSTSDESHPLFQFAKYLLLIAAVVTVLGNVAWSFFNRRSYDKLKEVIAEQNALIESHEKRHANLKLVASEAETRLTCRITTLQGEIERLGVNNQAVVSQNLQMKAILKQQRLAGTWQGHEDALFHYED